MELPLLKLYLRRLLATPTGLPLREALRTARVRALLAVLGWTVAATLTLCAIGHIYGDGYGYSDSLSDWLRDGGAQLLIVACTLAGVWYLLFLPAEVMASLARQGKSDAPDWYASPLDSSRAVLSSLLAALLAALPAAAGLALYLFFTNEFTALQPDGGSSLLTSYHHVDLIGLSLPGLGLLLLRLPAYVLFTGCLSLALRRHTWGPYVPALSALTGAALTQWKFDPVAALPYDRDWIPFAARSALLLALPLLFLGSAMLSRLARRERSAALGGAALVLLVGIPLAMAPLGIAVESNSAWQSAGVAGWSAGNWSNKLSDSWASATPIHAWLIDLAGNTSPNLPRLSPETALLPLYALAEQAYPVPQADALLAPALNFSDPNGDSGWHPAGPASAGQTPPWGSLAMIMGFLAIVWWLGCCAALDSARNIRRQMRPAPLPRNAEAGRLPARP